MVCGVICSAEVDGDGKESSATLTVETLKFSWELAGSIASLLGTGVRLDDFGAWGSVFVRFDSLKQGDESGALAVGFGVGVERETLVDLEKN